MTAVLLTPEARRDLSEIRAYSKREWGAEQARIYLEGMGRHFARIAAGELISRPAEDVHPAYRFTRYGSHFVFFQASETEIHIVRILHVRSDVARHLAP